MPADDHAVYLNAPVALVAVEVRFPGALGAPLPAAVQPALRELLGDGWVYDEVPGPTFTVNVGLAGPAGPMMGGPGPVPAGTMLRFANRERSTAVALTAASVSVETTAYYNWPQFRSVLERAVRAAGELLRPEGVIRVGVRYIDEVRVEGLSDALAWADWLTAAALPPASEFMSRAGHPPVNWNGAAQYQIGDDRSLVLRYGPQPPQPGFAVNPDGPLRRPGPRPQGPFYLFDFDAFWQPATIPSWDSEAVIAACDELRRPVRALFDELITERLESDVFNSGRSDDHERTDQ